MMQSLLSALFLGMIPAFSLQPNLQFEHDVVASLSLPPPMNPLSIEESLSASGIVIIERDTGQVLYHRASEEPRAMASLTKIMTALIIVEQHELNELVTIPAAVEDIEGNAIDLVPGQRFTVADLLSATLIASANDAALTLALYHSGSVEGFAEAMNDRAISLGLGQTSFVNPTGLDGENQYATAQDIAWLMSAALRHEAIANRMNKRGAFIYNTEGESIHLLHTHQLLHESRKILYGKTGTTDSAKQCLASILRQNGREYVVVIMHSDERYADMRTVMGALETHVEGQNL